MAVRKPPIPSRAIIIALIPHSALEATQVTHLDKTQVLPLVEVDLVVGLSTAALAVVLEIIPVLRQLANQTALVTPVMLAVLILVLVLVLVKIKAASLDLQMDLKVGLLVGNLALTRNSTQITMKDVLVPNMMILIGVMMKVHLN